MTKKKFLFLLSKAPYDKVNTFTGARIALTTRMEEHEVKVVLVEDGVYGANKNIDAMQFYNIAEYLSDLIEMGGQVLICGACIRERGISEESLIEGSEVIDMFKLVDTMGEADQTIFF